jgi:hypothetical protein
MLFIRQNRPLNGQVRRNRRSSDKEKYFLLGHVQAGTRFSGKEGLVLFEIPGLVVIVHKAIGQEVLTAKNLMHVVGLKGVQNQLALFDGKGRYPDKFNALVGFG